MSWTEQDYEDAKALQAKNPHPEFAAAIAKYEAEHRPQRETPEERGAREGFVTQLHPTSGPQLAPQSELPRDVEGLKAQEEARKETWRGSLKRPDEYINPVQGNEPLSAVRSFLPDWAGGQTHMWKEPSLEDFRRLGPGFFGDKAKELGLDSQEYKDFADAMWADEFDRAQAAGQNIVRTSAATGSAKDFARSTVAGVVNRAPEALGTTAASAAESATLGLGTAGMDPERRAELAAMQEEYPVANAIGNLLGIFKVPGSAVEQIGSRASKLFGLGKALEGSSPSMLKTALRGAGAGAVTSGAAQAVPDIIDAAKGQTHDDETARMVDALGIGGVMGALAGGGAASARSLRNPDTPLGREILLAEGAMGRGEKPVRATRVSLQNPIAVPETVKAAEAESMGNGGPIGPSYGASPTDLLAQKAAPKIAESALGEERALVDHISRVKEKYYANVPDQQPPRKLAGALQDVLNNRSYANGEPLPATRTEEFRRVLNQTLEVIPDLEGGRAREIAQREGGHVWSYNEAQRLGLNVEGVEGMTPQQAARLKVVVKPRPLNARALDEVAAGLDDLANASSLQGAKDPAWERLQRAIREDRDRFPWPASMGPSPEATLEDGTKVKGWSAFHTLASQDLSALGQRMQLAGIPRGKNVSPEAAELGVRQAAIGFRRPERDAADQALMSFMGGQTAPLWDIATARSAGAVDQLPTTRSSRLRMARVALDPIAQWFGSHGIPLGVAASSGGLIPGAAGLGRDVKDLAVAAHATPSELSAAIQRKPKKKKEQP